MRILVINSGCLKVNCSANLCHIAYIQGFVENGCDVTVVSKSGRGLTLDSSLKLPEGPRYIEIDGSIMSSIVGGRAREAVVAVSKDKSNYLKQMRGWIIQLVIKTIYGELGVSQAWVNNLCKKFKDKIPYDLIVSLSGPVTSHMACVELIKKRNVTGHFFCELWEDPWQLDLFNDSVDSRKKKLEEETVCKADKVLYVSPITLDNQRKFLPKGKNKMDWVPLPYYYKQEKIESFESLTYGYYGDYFPNSRNILPFYEAAKRLNAKVHICGNPVNLIYSKDNIDVHPRVTIEELKKYENDTNVLVLVCNLRGGQIPGKIYQYAATKKKILFILDGATKEKQVLREYFEKFNRFHFCENEVEDICRAMKDLQSNNDISNEPLEFFSPKNITSEIIRKCVQSD